MKERIQELKKQAFDAVWDLDKTTIGPPTHFVPDGFEQKFAELIVRECAQVIQDKNDIENYLDSWDHGFVAGLATAIDAIEQHFEVE